MTVLPDPAGPMDPATAAATFAAILDAEVPAADLGTFLLALAARGETAIEVAAAAAALRARMVPVAAPAGAIDLCGTGGDGQHSLNVSTAAAFVVAAAGVPVAKHGNRAQSSRTGTADVLEALGADLALPRPRIEACLAELGIAFLFAQHHHPAMAQLAPVRRALGVRTIFNLLGPLANPAGVRRQMIGVFAPFALPLVADAAAMLGSEAVLVVHGNGLDEIAVHAPTAMVWMRHGRSRRATFEPFAHGLGPHPLAALAGADAESNARALRAVLSGARETAAQAAYRAIVIANAAAALKLAGRVRGWDRAIALATAQIDSGAAADRLTRFIAFR
jgi:anthranilate phosphoribosyltransferase